MGNLVITVISMSKDLLAFAIVYMVSIFGFGVAMKAMFQNDTERNVVFPRAGMSTVTSSVLSLFDATLGQHDYEGDMPDPSNPAFYVGLIIQIVFLI